MALKFPDKDPDERLDYTVDWSRYLDTLTISSVQWTFITHSATALTNGAVTSSTSVTLDGNSGTIGVGMTVTGTGISGTVTVSAVSSQNSITLSSAQTIADDVTLTFTSTAGVESPALSASSTVFVKNMCETPFLLSLIASAWRGLRGLERRCGSDDRGAPLRREELRLGAQPRRGGLDLRCAARLQPSE